MKPTTTILIIIVAFLIAAVGVLAYMGFITIPGLEFRTNDASPGALNCDYTDQQILDMISKVSGKHLDSMVGLPFVRSLNMQACGSEETQAEVVAYYASKNLDYHLLTDATSTGSGWSSRNVAWGNAATLNESTLINAVMVFHGATVNTLYGYNTMTLTGDGTKMAYAAFSLWIAAS